MDVSYFESLSPEKQLDYLYEEFDEEQRLTASFSRSIEFKTTMNIILEHAEAPAHILDVGAATGIYSVPLVAMGHTVDAVEIVGKHVQSLLGKKEKAGLDGLSIYHQSALDMSNLESHSYDLGLCFGPLYHLVDDNDQKKVISEMCRLIKDHGVILFSFINNDMVIATETYYSQGLYLVEQTYDHMTFKVEDKPFVFHTLTQAKELLESCGLEIIEIIASDGLSELMRSTLDAMDNNMQKQWLKYHDYTCRKPEFLGASNHWLFVTKNK